MEYQMPDVEFQASTLDDSIELCDQLGALGSPSRRQPATDAIC